MSTNERDRLFKELSRAQNLLDEATKKHDVRRKVEFESVVKTIKDQIRACGATGNNPSPTLKGNNISNSSLYDSGSYSFQPPTAPQSIPSNRPSIFSSPQG